MENITHCVLIKNKVICCTIEQLNLQGEDRCEAHNVKIYVEMHRFKKDKVLMY